MSDSGDFDFNPTSQQASDQAAPGWYFAQGDPPGTERYWTGTAWEGAYRAVGGFTPAESGKPPPFPSWAKVLAWILTVLKGLPLMALAVLLAVWGAITDAIQDETDFRFREFSVVVLVIGVIVLFIGVVLLLGQLIAVMKEQVGRAVVWSGILTVLDAVFAVANVFDGGIDNASLFLGLLVVQGGLFAAMFKLWNDQRTGTV